MNSQSPLVSVLMSCYNSEEYIDEAINSILNQTYQKFEFIIINDGSTDTTLAHIQDFHDDRIKIINRENKGLVYSLNEGLKICQGKYVVRMDADDISLLNRIEKQILFLEENPEISVCGGAIEEFDEQGVIKTIIKPTTHIDLLFYSLKSSPLAHPAATIRRSVLTKYQIQYDLNYKYGQDVKLWSEIIRIGKLANLKDVVLKYRRSENQVSKSKRKEQKALAQTARAEIYQHINNESDLFQTASAINLKDYFKYMVRHDSSMHWNKKIKEICTSRLPFSEKAKLSLYSLAKNT